MAVVGSTLSKNSLNPGWARSSTRRSNLGRGQSGSSGSGTGGGGGGVGGIRAPLRPLSVLIYLLNADVCEQKSPNASLQLRCASSDAVRAYCQLVIATMTAGYRTRIKINHHHTAILLSASPVITFAITSWYNTVKHKAMYIADPSIVEHHDYPTNGREVVINGLNNNPPEISHEDKITTDYTCPKRHSHRKAQSWYLMNAAQRPPRLSLPPASKTDCPPPAT